MKILLIEDDPEIARVVALTLTSMWAEASLIATAYGMEGIELVKKESPDLVILDLGLPDIDGIEVLQQIHSCSDTLVVILTVRGEEDNKLKGLLEGADDYILKPFWPKELVARMKALIRRRETTKVMARVATKRLRVDFANQIVNLGDKSLRMGPDQYDLFCLLVKNKGVGVSKQTLLKQVFPEKENDARIVDVFINRIREQLEENPNNPEIIIDDGTTGYKFVGSYSVVGEA